MKQRAGTSVQTFSNLVLISSISWLACARIATAQTDPEREVRCTEIAFSLSVEHKDREAFVSFLRDDARFVSRRTTRGPQEISEAWSVFFEPDGATIQWRPDTVEVNAEGTMALSRGPYRETRLAEDGSRTDRA